MDAEEGILFMQEMIELSQLQKTQDVSPQAVSFPIKVNDEFITVTIKAGPAHFGVNLKGDKKVVGEAVIVHPIHGCKIPPTKFIEGRITIVERGQCLFVEKARNVQNLGAIGAIVIDNTPGSSSTTSSIFAMSGDGNNDIKIPVVFLFSDDASKFLTAFSNNPSTKFTISEYKNNVLSKEEGDSFLQKFKVSVQKFLNANENVNFQEIVRVDDFEANVGANKIKITFIASDKRYSCEQDKSVNLQWNKIRKGLLLSILLSDKKELFIPVKILRIYFVTLHNNAIDKLEEFDILKQTKWLLKELSFEYCKQQSDSSLENDFEKISKMSEQQDKLSTKNVISNDDIVQVHHNSDDL